MDALNIEGVVFRCFDAAGRIGVYVRSEAFCSSVQEYLDDPNSLLLLSDYFRRAHAAWLANQMRQPLGELHIFRDRRQAVEFVEDRGGSLYNLSFPGGRAFVADDEPRGLAGLDFDRVVLHAGVKLSASLVKRIEWIEARAWYRRNPGIPDVD